MYDMQGRGYMDIKQSLKKQQLQCTSIYEIHNIVMRFRNELVVFLRTSYECCNTLCLLSVCYKDFASCSIERNLFGSNCYKFMPSFSHLFVFLVWISNVFFISIIQCIMDSQRQLHQISQQLLLFQVIIQCQSEETRLCELHLLHCNLRDHVPCTGKQ